MKIDGQRTNMSDKRGYLNKRGHLVKNWKERWFWLNTKDKTLSYFASSQQKKRLGIIPLTNCRLEACELIHIYGFLLIPSNAKKAHSEYAISAQNGREFREWMDAIREVISSTAPRAAPPLPPPPQPRLMSGPPKPKCPPPPPPPQPRVTGPFASMVTAPAPAPPRRAPKQPTAGSATASPSATTPSTTPSSSPQAPRRATPAERPMSETGADEAESQDDEIIFREEIDELFPLIEEQLTPGALDMFFREFFSTVHTRIEGEEMEQPSLDVAGFAAMLEKVSPGSSEIAELLFQLFDQNGDGVVDLREFIIGITMISRAPPEQKIEYAFRAYDLDGDGSISQEEMSTMLSIVASVKYEHSVKLKYMVNLLVKEAFSKYDIDRNGTISLDELQRMLEAEPEMRAFFLFEEE
eukprot:gnl/Trimastix_PCT/2330.p1 GENE.gnl/Trimastix_PCT/2330~~gnl/Trimastix_PCT/2330.p1  ORF type:complete len:439 (-),score=100.53 gnl/Trimastix_PCT/2330:137-1366(-)